jgi:hypothetical protein
LKQSDRPSLRPRPAHFERNKTWEGSTAKNIHQVMQVEMQDKNNQVWYLDQAERLNAFEFNNFQNWICSAGYRSIIIREPDGVIKRGYSCGDQPLGHIETGFELFAKPAPCVSKSCVSSADSKIPKRKADHPAPLWASDKTYER